MPNPRFGDASPQKVDDSRKPPMKRGQAAPNVTPDKTASWPGLPGGTQPRSRLNGVSEVKQSLHKDGL